MAAQIKLETGIEPRLAKGGLGEFSVCVDGKLVARKGWIKLPTSERVLAAVRAALRS